MKRKKLYHNTIEILANAYHAGILQRSRCQQCAVGVLVAGNMGINISAHFGWDEMDCRSKNTVAASSMDGWPLAFRTAKGVQFINPEYYAIPQVKTQIDSTGYTLNDLAKIEHAFESSDNDGEGLLPCIMAVIDVLDEIHENKDVLITTSVKQRFVKVPA